ncbi:hypothetical protein M427DRAFT_45306 [Gonapodya prolifera JEL478]|uniref:Uncharacterized protein n=1 Tax=Gonapodya prolifera (strain JEL478) TaxID=1344416 RepID=A0A139AB10_GONPJ|nr:hypothetical protein M427DRAFT_45306 [Gonapodya prolifera JEL478]|eukprot:KXS14012.1 hypothetical protein M427DRAFT_45306 [Gonapodya prolifera JEL478]
MIVFLQAPAQTWATAFSRPGKSLQFSARSSRRSGDKTGLVLSLESVARARAIDEGPLLKPAEAQRLLVTVAVSPVALHLADEIGGIAEFVRKLMSGEGPITVTGGDEAIRMNISNGRYHDPICVGPCWPIVGISASIVDDYCEVAVLLDIFHLRCNDQILKETAAMVVAPSLRGLEMMLLSGHSFVDAKSARERIMAHSGMRTTLKKYPAILYSTLDEPTSGPLDLWVRLHTAIREIGSRNNKKKQHGSSPDERRSTCDFFCSNIHCPDTEYWPTDGEDVKRRQNYPEQGLPPKVGKQSAGFGVGRGD